MAESPKQRKAREKAAKAAKAQVQGKQLSVSDVIEKSQELGVAAMEMIGNEAFEQLPSPTVSPVISLQPNRIIEAYLIASKSKEVFDLAKSTLDIEKAAFEDEKAGAAQERESLRADAARMVLREAAVSERETSVAAREIAVAAREDEVLSGCKKQIDIERDAWSREKADQERGLDERKSAVSKEEERLKKEFGKIVLDREILDEDRNSLETRIDRRAAALAAVDRQELEIATRRASTADTQITELLGELAEFKTARWSGGGDLSVMTARYKDLEANYKGLLESIANYPSPAEIERLRGQDNEMTALREQVAKLVREKDSLNTSYGRMIQSVGELESMRDQKESAEAQLKIVRDELRKLKVQIEGEKNEDGSFPALAKIDRDSIYQTSPTATKWNVSGGLGVFVKEVQQSIRQLGFDYSLPDLRSFVAGLAMSRLHILQGISGTGKTSLPRLFAQCINSGVPKQGVKIIEVQAGWRDRQDLLGYYNAFEKTYRQTEFLRALYEAGTPRYRDSPYIIILDEMNLSRPEQYFADLLSALEGDSDDELSEKLLVLMDRPLDDAPKLFVDHRKITIPKNVWFVGTANHDETTLEFADKTYDRAHILELPHEPTPVALGQAPQGGRLLYGELQSLFTKAIASHESEASKAKTFFSDYVEHMLGEEFGIGIGNRLKKRQLGIFVPVYIASGGNTGEALDHILVTRVLRKTIGLHDTTGEQFRVIAKRLNEGWRKMGFPGRPDRTISLLNREVRVKEPGNTASVWQ